MLMLLLLALLSLPRHTNVTHQPRSQSASYDRATSQGQGNNELTYPPSFGATNPAPRILASPSFIFLSVAPPPSSGPSSCFCATISAWLEGTTPYLRDNEAVERMRPLQPWACIRSSRVSGSS